MTRLETVDAGRVREVLARAPVGVLSVAPGRNCDHRDVSTPQRAFLP